MKKITKKLMFILLLLIAGFGYSQKVAVIGINHVGADGFSFVVTEDLTNGEVIYFTENEYDNVSNVFTDLDEAVVAFTAGSAIPKGNVVFVSETGTSTNVFTVSCTGGTCGTAVIVGAGSFSIATDGEALYAYSDSDNNPTNGVTTIHSVMYTGITEPSTVNGGLIPAALDPSVDYPTAIVIDGFPAVAPGRVEFNPTTLARTDVSKVILENPSNYVHAQSSAALSTIFFTNLNLVSASPVLTVTASPGSVMENSGTGMVYTFSLSVNAPSAITVNFAVTGSAIFGTDYTQTGAASFSTTTGTITIPGGSNSAVMTLTPIADAGLEAHESIVITLSAGSGYVAGSPGSATTMINNDDSTNNDPLVALVGISHTDPDGFSFVATKDIVPGTEIYFTDKSFNNNTLLFGSGEAVLRWTSPGTTVPKGNVVVVAETGTNTNVFTVSCSDGTCGSIAFVSGDFAISTTGETMYAYADNDGDPSNGVTDIYSVLFTGTSIITGGNIPAIEDPSTVFLSALVVDGFPSTPLPGRTEYDATKRGILVTDAVFEDISNWVFGQGTPALSTVLFSNINVIDGVPPTAVCQNISVTPDVGTGSVTITASQINNGSSDNVGIASISVSPDTFTCANVGTPVTVTLTVTDTSGNIATCTATVTVLPNTAATFTQVDPICAGGSFTLPTTSDNGYTGTWAPAIDNTQTTTYTFTPNAGQCGSSATMQVVVNPVVAPTFTQVDPICSGGSFTLPATSDNGITGTWSPAVDNTQTTLYTFTPDGGQCAVSATMTVVVNSIVTPTFTQVDPICSGDSFTLPATSDNGITGTWSPAVDNTQTTLYTFTPDGGQCAVSATMTVVVNPIVAPTFTQVDPICSGGSFTLPATSDNGITGTWSPAFDNTQTTLYTFTPDGGQCAVSATMTVIVNPNVAPTFTQVDPICSGGSFTLPATSDNGITGTWSPAVDNTQTTLYTFTPDGGQCALSATMTVVVNPIVTPSFTQIAPICSGSSLILPTTSDNGITGTWSPVADNTQTTLYTFTPDAGQCAVTATMTVVVNPNFTYYADADGDGYGDPSVTVIDCQMPVGYVTTGTDCDDTRDNVYPGAPDICGDGLDNDCNGIIDNVGQIGGCNPGQGALTGTYCGATLNNAAVTLVSNYVQGAQGYRFRVRNEATDAVIGIVDRPVNSFALSNMAGITLGTTYLVDVALMVGNVWQPFYGQPCTVTTPTPLATIGAHCGTTLSSMGQWIYANYQPSVTAYRFRLTNTATNEVVVYDALSGLNKFNFNQLPATFRTMGTTYIVEVALRNTDGSYLPYGTGCTVSTPGATTRGVVESNVFAAITYPNPFAENFMFDVKTTSKNTIQIKVYDMIGKQVENRDVEAADINSLQFGDLYPAGVYNVVLSQGENTQIMRVIKR